MLQISAKRQKPPEAGEGAKDRGRLKTAIRFSDGLMFPISKTCSLQEKRALLV
ncbi:hypothetical protein [Kingella potus]|uniref:hypothetical protein n=1 Tax=Kingella potus TaxID=265175 RepID=UPI001FD1CA50|nr:hypothetical protein [Kingella potus]UOP01614.1 hypothetical protein LVJ84_05475 [Kingella potus]